MVTVPITLAAVALISADAFAVDPAPFATALPSQRPAIELPGVYKPQIQGQQGYAGFDTPRVCGNTSLSSAYRAGCLLEMNAAATEAARADVRKRYDAQIATPPPEIASKRPSATPLDETTKSGAEKEEIMKKESDSPEESADEQP